MPHLGEEGIACSLLVVTPGRGHTLFTPVATEQYQRGRGLEAVATAALPLKLCP